MMSPALEWQLPWLLTSLHIYQQFYSFYLILKCVLSFLYRIAHAGWPTGPFNTYPLADIVIPIVILVTISIEKNNLRPKGRSAALAIVQAAKAGFLVYDTWPFIVRPFHGHQIHLWASLSLWLFLVSHFVLTVLATWNWYSVKRWSHNDHKQISGIDSDLVILDPQTAESLRSKDNTPYKVIGRIYNPTTPQCLERWPRLGNCVKFFSVAYHWISGVFILVFTVGMSSYRMAGEPRQVNVLSNPAFHEWKYAQPTSLKPRYHDNRTDFVDDNSDAVPAHITGEEVPQPSERASDSLSLHTIPDVQIRRQRTPLGSRRDVTSSRLLRPRHLCLLDDDHPQGFRVVRADDRESTNYMFISYTRRQFYTQIAGDSSLPSEDNAKLVEAAQRDTSALLQLAVTATKSAGIQAFWIDFECVIPEEGENAQESMQDVYRICDIVRASHSMAIMLAPFLDDDMMHVGGSTKEEWLRDWGQRLWTVPEALLCPAEHGLRIYTSGVGSDPQVETEPEQLAKRNLAGRAWNDAAEMRELMDHYEGTIHLTQLELITTALKCLQRRQTVRRMSGDVTYALMGLLRRRPKVNSTDSDFQAFARLSMANDSDMLLERLLCLQSNGPDEPWYDMNDAWGAELWDINPYTQIVDIADGSTVTLGGVSGALINWDYLHPVDFEASRRRILLWTLTRAGLGITFAMCLVLALVVVVWSAWPGTISKEVGSVMLPVWFGVIGILLLPSSCLALATPLLLKRIYSGEILKTQARFFGIEGRADIGKVEQLVFGWNMGRIKWTCDDAIPPSDQHSGLSPETRHFTLIDTFTMQAFYFPAVEPPAVVLAFGGERGLVRTLLCAYDWQTQSFSEIIVLRMKAMVLDRMSKMDAIRLVVKRPAPTD